jgi:hypothetical protein
MKRLLFSILFLTMTPAFAVDFNTHILSIEGKDIPTSATDQSPVTLGKVCEDALIATLPGDNPTPDEKGNRFRLAMKVHEGKNLTSEDITLLKKVIGLAYGPLVVGRAIELLDPASVPK